MLRKGFFQPERKETEVGVEKKKHIKDVVADGDLFPDFRNREGGEYLLDRPDDNNHEHETG